MKRLTLTLIVSSLLVACQTGRVEPQITLKDNQPDYDQFVSTNQFPYVAPEERRSQIQTNYSKLSVGLTKTEVVKILGRPDYSRATMTKGSKSEYIGSGWTYFIAKPEPELVNTIKDLSVQVFFDLDGKTKWIATNIDGLNDIGHPGR